MVINQLLPRLEGFALKSKSTDVITAFRIIIERADTADNNDIEKDVIIEKIEEEKNDNNIGENRDE